MNDPRPDPPVVDLVPLGDCVAGLVDIDPSVGEGEGRLTVERLAVALPVEVAVGEGEDGALRVEASPPTQHVETSVLPVFHRLRVTLEEDDARR